MTTELRLRELIVRLENGEDRASVERDAVELFRTLDQRELLAAEEQLAARGLRIHPTLCAAHREAVGGDRDAFRARLPDGHVLATLMDEHVRLLAKLERLAELCGAEELDRPALEEIAEIGRHLVGAEPHHAREEQVLFPALVARGLAGPPRVMEMEHVGIRSLKHAIIDLAGRALAGDSAETGAQDALRQSARKLVADLREHIAKEDGILYPMSFDTITDPAEWEAMRARCDEIGYCAGH